MSMPGGFRAPKTSAPLLFVSFIFSVIRWAVLVAILLLLAPLALSYVENAQKFPAVTYLFQAHDYLFRALAAPLQQAIPTRIAGADRTVWILVAVLAFIAIAAGSLRRRMYRLAARRQMQKVVARWKNELQIQQNSAASQAIDSKILQLENSGNLNREELLKVFAGVKRQLDALGREVAFLSIDVIGSTAMKENEEPAAIQYDFFEYRKLVENVFRARGAMKSTWTPDGVMACFANLKDAIGAGQDVINALPYFNQQVKLIRREFAVRCGVNAGYVHFDEATPLEAMSDRVIDVAGHMQKYAEPNTVAVARKLVEPLPQADGFQATRKTVDGYEVSHWVGGRYA